MIARDRLAHAMAAAFTDAELEAMRIAVDHVQAERSLDRRRAAERKSLATNPPIAREEPQETPAAPARHRSSTRVKSV